MDLNQKYFKIYGIQRSGTNYVRYLLMNNFKDVQVWNNVGGWKHDRIVNYPVGKEILHRCDDATKKKYKKHVPIIQKLYKQKKIRFIVCVKDPYSWILSYHQYLKQKLTYKSIAKYIKEWNRIYTNYMKFIKSGDAILIKYEDLLFDHSTVLSKIMDSEGLIRSKSLWQVPVKKMAASGDNRLSVVGKTQFDASYYLDRRYLKLLSPGVLKVINKNLMPEAFSFYGYTKVRGN